MIEPMCLAPFNAWWPVAALLVSGAGPWPRRLPTAFGPALDAITPPTPVSELGGLAVGLDHAPRAGSLPGPHRDPFDWRLIAQTMVEGVPVVTIDRLFRDDGVAVIR